MYTAQVNGKEFKVEVDSSGKEVEVNGEAYDLDMIQVGEGKYHLIKDHKSYSIEILKSDSKEKVFEIKINGTIYPVQLKDKFDELLKNLGMENLNSDKHKDLKAPMPGLVIDIMISEGQEVEKNDPLFILEAMKMENVIKSPGDGVVKKITMEQGKAVEKNEVLVEFE